MATAGITRRRKPHFFKPILPPFQRFSIPRAFLKHLVDEMSTGEGEATLRNHRRAWRVKVNGFCFTDGWLDFVRDNDIRLGHFVVFRYEGAMVFNVMVFDRSSCEKEYMYPLPPPPPTIVIKTEDEKEESQDTEEEIKTVTPPSGRVMTRSGGPKATKPCASSESIPDSFKVSIRQYNLKKGSLNIPSFFAKSNGLRKIFEVILRNEKGKSWSVKLTNCIDGRVRMGAGWNAFSSANHLKEGHSCLFKLNKSGPKIHKGGADAIVLDVTVFRFSSERRAWLKDNKRTDIKPSLPCNTCFAFAVSLKPSNFKESCLNIPMGFSRSNGLMGKLCDVTLRDRKGRSWRMQLRHRNKSNGAVSINGDWVEIFAPNVLREGDTCIFELVRRNKMRVMEFLLL